MVSKIIDVAVALGVLITALGTVGLPLVLALFTVGALLTGYLFSSTLSWLSQWFFPLIFAGTGLIALMILAKQGAKVALVGVATFVGLLVLSYFLATGALSSPGNYFALLSVTGKSSMAIPVGPTVAFIILAIIAAVLDFTVAVIVFERANIFNSRRK
jgi:hypothetical protein